MPNQEVEVTGDDLGDVGRSTPHTSLRGSALAQKVRAIITKRANGPGVDGGWRGSDESSQQESVEVRIQTQS